MKVKNQTSLYGVIIAPMRATVLHAPKPMALIGVG